MRFWRFIDCLPNQNKTFKNETQCKKHKLKRMRQLGLSVWKSLICKLDEIGKYSDWFIKAQIDKIGWQ